MKKFIVALAALVSMSAFADHHGRHMVTLSGWENDVQDRSLDFSWGKGDGKGTDDSKTQNIALNYAYAVTDAWQVGAKYKQYTAEDKNPTVADRIDTENKTMGLFVIYNFQGQLVDTNYLSLGYDMSEADAGGTSKEVETNTWNLEFGHRFSLGTLWSMNFNWSPSVMYSRSNVENDNAADKKFTTQEIALNVLKVDVIF